MPVDLLADENIDQFIISGLRNAGYTVYSVREDNAGISDAEVIDLAVEKQALILSEDKDFGEWVFSHHRKTLGVILLRYQFPDRERLLNALETVLQKYGKRLHDRFSVVTTTKIRIRDL